DRARAPDEDGDRGAPVVMAQTNPTQPTTDYHGRPGVRSLKGHAARSWHARARFTWHERCVAMPGQRVYPHWIETRGPVCVERLTARRQGGIIASGRLEQARLVGERAPLLRTPRSD